MQVGGIKEEVKELGSGCSFKQEECKRWYCGKQKGDVVLWQNTLRDMNKKVLRLRNWLLIPRVWKIPGSDVAGIVAHKSFIKVRSQFKCNKPRKPRGHNVSSQHPTG